MSDDRSHHEPFLSQAKPAIEGGRAPLDCIGPSEKCRDCALRDSDCTIAWFGQRKNSIHDFERRKALKDLLGD